MSSGAVAASRASSRRRIRSCIRESIFDLPVSQRDFSCLFAKVLIMAMCKLTDDRCKPKIHVLGSQMLRDPSE